VGKKNAFVLKWDSGKARHFVQKPHSKGWRAVMFALRFDEKKPSSKGFRATGFGVF